MRYVCVHAVYRFSAIDDNRHLIEERDTTAACEPRRLREFLRRETLARGNCSSEIDETNWLRGCAQSNHERSW